MNKDNMDNTTSQALVAPSDIAEMAGVSRGAVSNWRKRAEDFPEPRGGTAAKPLFPRGAVIAWLSSRGYDVKKDSGEARVWSAMNALRGAMTIEAMSDLILALACARKLSSESMAVVPPWVRIHGEVATGGLAALTDVTGKEADHDPRWSSLVNLPAALTQIAEPAVAAIVGALDDVDVDDLTSVTDYVLAKLARAQIRVGLHHGFVESRISEALGNLAAANGGRTLYDPACGIGTALLTAVDAGLEPERVVGHDINESALRQAAQRAYLRGVDIELARGDVLTNDLNEQLRADVIVAEPPFAMKLPPTVNMSDCRWEFGMPPRRASEMAWIQHVAFHLAPSGRGFVVTPMGALFRIAGEKAVRTELVRRGCVEAIIGLPGKMLPHIALPLAVWVLRAPGDDARSDILFIDASDVTDVEKRIGDWLPALNGENIDVPHQRVDIRDVLAGDNLIPARWIQVAGRNPAEVASTYVDSWKNLNQTLDHIAGVNESLHHFSGTRSSRVVTVGDLIDQGLLELHPGRVSSSDLPNDLKHLYVAPAQIKAGQLPEGGEAAADPDLHLEWTQDGEVLVSTHGVIGAVVDEGGGHLIGFGVYRLRCTDVTQLSPDYLALVLAGSWNERFHTGTVGGRADIRQLEVPLVSQTEQAHAKLADLSVQLLIGDAQSLLANAQSVREAMRDALRYNITIPGSGSSPR